jgi:hypothetical protein
MYIGRQSDFLIRLLNGTNPVTGIAYDDISVFLWKQGDTTWAPVGILSSEWKELDNGYYIINLRASMLNVLGAMAIKVSGTPISTVIKEGFIEPLPPLFAIDASKCVVSGNIIDLTGDTGNKNYDIEFSLVTLPQKIGGVSLVSSDKIHALPDAFGNFSVMLLCGTTVLVEIERAGIKNQIVIPDQTSANLIDLLPPF